MDLFSPRFRVYEGQNLLLVITNVSFQGKLLIRHSDASETPNLWYISFVYTRYWELNGNCTVWRIRKIQIAVFGFLLTK